MLLLEETSVLKGLSPFTSRHCAPTYHERTNSGSNFWDGAAGENGGRLYIHTRWVKTTCLQPRTCPSKSLSLISSKTQPSGGVVPAETPHPATRGRNSPTPDPPAAAVPTPAAAAPVPAPASEPLPCFSGAAWTDVAVDGPEAAVASCHCSFSATPPVRSRRASHVSPCMRFS